MTKHHILYPLLAVIILAVAVSWFRAHEAWRDSQHQEEIQKIAADHVKEIEAVRQEETAKLQELASRPPTVETVTKLLPMPLPGRVEVQPVGPQQAPTLTISGDPQANLKAIQDMEVKCAQCQIDLTAAKATLAEDSTAIGSLEKEKASLMKFAIPRWTATLGVTKQGQQGAYKPAALLDYRVGQRWGVTFGAANNALFGGVSIHFGDLPKAK